MGAMHCIPSGLKSKKKKKKNNPRISSFGDPRQRQEKGRGGSVQVAVLGRVFSTLNPTL